MKKASTLCLTIPALLVAGTASAATVYDQNGSKLDLYGRATGMYYGSDNDELSGDQSYFRLGLKGETAINSELSGIGQVEYNLPTSGSDNDELRLGYAGLRHATFGQLTYGRQDGLFSMVNDYTDVLPEFGGDGLGKGTEVFGTGRTNGLFKYAFNYNGVTLGLQYTGKNDPQNNDTSKWMLGSDAGYAVGLSYDAPIGLSIATVYNRAGKTDDQKQNATFGGQDDAQLTGVGVRYNANNLYAAATYSEGRDHYAIGDGYAHKSRGYEAVVQYTVADKFVPGLAYVRSEVKDASQNIDDKANEYVSVNAAYHFNDNFQSYVDYRINMLDDNSFTQTYGINTDDVVAVGMRYDF
ncbi:porin [Pseudaeromonas sharmana]|uniref:Porin n=1 Tax=Pseudaeromonas sharmana TaxID=328412 RepID=A0ABV8CI43_9GAMM